MRRLILVLIPALFSAAVGCQDPYKESRENDERLREIREATRRLKEELNKPWVPVTPLRLPCHPSSDEKVLLALPDGSFDWRIKLKKESSPDRMVISKAKRNDLGPNPLFGISKIKEDTLVNMGCDAATVDEFKGQLTVINAELRPAATKRDETDKRVPIVLGADTVLLCDDANKYLVLGGHIKGRTVLMNGFSYSSFFAMGNPSITTDRLILRGSNSFIMQASLFAIGTAPKPIEVQIDKSLEGDGQLVVDSLGVICPEAKN